MSDLNNREFPLVSIVILTYQNFMHLGFTLETISIQKYHNYEIVISDDASSFFPRKEIEHLVEVFFSGLGISVAIRKNDNNLGLVAHSNVVARSCNGRYIKFLSPGDGFCSSDSLAELVNLISSSNMDIATSPAYVYVNSPNTILYQLPSMRRIRLLKAKAADSIFSMIAAKNIISAVGTIYSKTFFEKRGFDERYYSLDDWPTWLLTYRTGNLIPVLNNPTVYYKLGGISTDQGTAFDSSFLKQDLLICYEKEILPYRKKLNLISYWIVQSHYEKLKRGTSTMFYLKYWPIEGYIAVKKRIKHLMILRQK